MPITEDEKTYYGRLVFAGLKNKISNFRDAKRILNKLDFDYGCLIGEVNIMDLLALTVLKINCPVVSAFLEKEGSGYWDNLGTIQEERSKKYEELKSSYSSADAWAVRVLEIIFPILKGDVNFKSLVPKKSICTEEHFRKYFQLAVPNGKVSDAEFLRLTKVADSHQRFFANLEIYQAQKIERQVIEGISKRQNLFTLDSLSNIITALLDFSDIANGEDRNSFSLTVSDLSFFTAVALLRGIDKSHRLVIFNEVLEKCRKGKSALIRFVDFIGREHGCFSPSEHQEYLHESEKYLSNEELEAAKVICIELIDRLNMPPEMDYDKLMCSPNMAVMFFALEGWKYQNLDTFRARLLGVKNGVLRMMRHFTTLVISSDDGAYLRTQFDGIRSFMGDNAPNDKIISDAEIQMKQCDDQKLTDEVKEGIKNALNPRR